MPPSLPFTRYVAELTVLRAALLTRRVISDVSEISKDDATPVTIADFGAQALIMASLRDAFPGDGFVGEEDAEVLRGDEKLRAQVFDLAVKASNDFAENERANADAYSTDVRLASLKSEDEMLELLDLAGSGKAGSRGRFWVMDPVDGTATFLKGQQYAVSLALIEDGKEVLGVLCYPNLSLEHGVVSETTTDRHGSGVMLSTLRGEGTLYRKLPSEYHLGGHGEQLDRFSAPANLTDLRFVDCLASKSSRLDIAEGLAKQIGALPFPGVDIWSSHVRYAALIIGEGVEKHIMIRVPVGKKGDPSRAYIWDHAGSQLMYTERGGKITDLEGKDIDFGAGRTLAANWGLVAAPEAVHGEILRLVREWVNKDIEKNGASDA
jgi:3'(2'), 5'-bisphosphate nucleotidase